MHTVIHPPVAAKSGESVRLIFTITDRAGNAVDVSAAEAVYRLARRAGEAALLQKSDIDGITLSSNTAAVEFDTGDLADAGVALTGDFFGQLTLTLNGDGLVVAEGAVSVAPIVRAPPG